MASTTWVPPDSAGATVRTFLTVVSCRAAISSSIGDRLESAAHEELRRRAQTRVWEVLERNRAAIVDTNEDVTIGMFGFPEVHEHDAWRAVRAAFEVRAELHGQDWQPDGGPGIRVGVGVGISTGAAMVHRSAAGGPVAAGDPVSLASQLLEVARPGDVLMTTATYRLVRHAVQTEPVVLFLGGTRNAPVRAYRLLDLLPGMPSRQRYFNSPMVGRERERRLAVELLELAAHDRTCHLLTVLGAPGIGKSRLIEEFTDAIASRARVLHGKCLWYGNGSTYWPLKSAVEEGAGLLEGDGPEEVRRKLVALLRSDSRADGIADQVAQMLGHFEPTGPPEQAFWSVRRLLEAMAQSLPLVLVFDDVQWAEPTFLDLIDHLVDHASDAPILVVCIARETEFHDVRPMWGGGKVNATTLRLRPLSETDGENLLTNLLGDARLPEETWTRIKRAAGGYPLFVEEMLAMLVDDGRLRRIAGRWRLAADPVSIVVPASLQELLIERLQLLPPASRAVIERAAIIGRVFYRGAVAELLPEQLRPEVDECLTELAERGFIRPVPSELLNDETFEFHHLLILFTAHDHALLSDAERSELHMRFARWLERVLEKRAREVDEIIGYHLEHAFKYRSGLGTDDEQGQDLADAAAERLARAGQRAFHLGDVTAAINLLTRAEALKQRSDVARLAVLAQLGQALRVAGDFPTAKAVLAEVIEGARANGEPRLEHLARVELNFVHLYTDPQGRTKKALEDAQDAIKVFKELGDDRSLGEAWNLVAVVHLMRCEMGERKRALEEALRCAQRVGDSRSEAWAAWGIISSMAYGPTHVEEVVAFAEAQLELARARGNRVLEAGAIVHLGRLEAMLGRFAEARQHIERARRLCEDVGLRTWAAICWQMSGYVESLAGDATAAERALREEYRALEQLQDMSYLATSAAYLADVLYDLGRDDEAVEMTRLTEQLAATDDVHAQVLWRSARAKALARQGQHAPALALAQEAARLAAPLDDWNTRAGALMDLAETMRTCGRSGETADVVEEARRLYEAKGNIVAAQRARAAAWTG